MFNLRNRSFLKELDFHPRPSSGSCCGSPPSSRPPSTAATSKPSTRGKNIALIFEKTSTRTRTAFEVAAKDQGPPDYDDLEPSGSQIGHKESMKDTARRWLTFPTASSTAAPPRQTWSTLAEFAGVPVWNGLTNEFHPTQILADMLTMTEHSDKHQKEPIAYCLPRRRPQQHGQLLDGRRVQVRHGRPPVRARAPVAGRGPGEAAGEIAEETGARLTLTADVDEGVRGAPTSSTPTCGSRWARTRASGRSGSTCSSPLPDQRPTCSPAPRTPR